MKRYVVWMGALFFVVMFTSLYLMLETVTNPMRGSNVAKMQAMEGIEAKIQKIEGDLGKNKELIRNIKIWIGLLAKGDDRALDELVKLVNTSGDIEQKAVDPVMVTERAKTLLPGQKEIYEVSPLGKVTVTGSLCTLATKPAADANINMKDVFDSLPFDNPDGGAWKQGWNVEYDEKRWQSAKLQIFVVPHSHCDPGWVKTFEDYYKMQTRNIFENMLVKLEEDKRRKFIFAEISYLSLWWDELDNAQRDRVRRLVKNGQLEIVTGGWVMTDEANTHYFAMVDQLLEGHQWLNGTMGVKPKSGWSIDPFGYSSTMAYLLKRTGFENMLIQRVHYSIKKHLARSTNLEFMWRQHWDQDHTADMFCHMMPFYSYDVPHTCGPDPMVCCQFDFLRMPGSKYNCPWKIHPVTINDQNVATRAVTLLDQYRKKAQLYKTNVLLAPLGDDFRYDTPEEWDLQFSNYQKLFDYINSHPELGAQGQFGTLSDYFNAVHAEVGQAASFFPSLTGDFFTYADRDDHYWSGYFTSRPFHKRLDRVLEANLRAAEIIFTLAQAYARKNTASNYPSVAMMEKLVGARRSLGLFQHHDGITGTAKDFVVIDYGQRMLQGLRGCKTVMTESLAFLLAQDKAAYRYTETLPFLSMDEIQDKHDSMPYKPVIVLGAEPVSVVVYNSLAHRRTELVTVRTSVPQVEVRDPQGHVVFSQSQPVFEGSSSAKTESSLVTFVAEVPALGVAVYTLRAVGDGGDFRNHLTSVAFRNTDVSGADQRFPIRRDEGTEDFTIKNSFLEATFDGMTGLLKTVKTLETGKEYQVGLQFVLYGTRPGKDKSGAYLFLPDGPGQIEQEARPAIRIERGPLLSEVHVFMPYVHNVVRLLNAPGIDSVSIDVHNIVDIRSLNNREIAMRINTDVANPDQVFFTDLNGFQMQRRQTYEKLPLQANFYPFTSTMFMQNSNTRFSVLAAQALGVYVPSPNSVDIMLDRRLNQDDGRGLLQGVMDNRVTPNNFRLLIETPHTMTLAQSPSLAYPSLMSHLTAQHLTHSLFAFPRAPGAETSNLALVPHFTPMGTELPCEVHLVNLRTQQNRDDDPAFKFIPRDSAAMILHHQASDCSFPVMGASCQAGDGKVILSEMFTDLKLGEFHETSLTMMHEQQVLTGTSVYHVPPMEIRTLRISLV